MPGSHGQVLTVGLKELFIHFNQKEARMFGHGYRRVDLFGGSRMKYFDENYFSGVVGIKK